MIKWKKVELNFLYGIFLKNNNRFVVLCIISQAVNQSFQFVNHLKKTKAAFLITISLIMDITLLLCMCVASES